MFPIVAGDNSSVNQSLRLEDLILVCLTPTHSFHPVIHLETGCLFIYRRCILYGVLCFKDLINSHRGALTPSTCFPDNVKHTVKVSFVVFLFFLSQFVMNTFPKPYYTYHDFYPHLTVVISSPLPVFSQQKSASWKMNWQCWAAVYSTEKPTEE